MLVSLYRKAKEIETSTPNGMLSFLYKEKAHIVPVVLVVLMCVPSFYGVSMHGWYMKDNFRCYIGFHMISNDFDLFQMISYVSKDFKYFK